MIRVSSFLLRTFPIPNIAIYACVSGTLHCLDIHYSETVRLTAHVATQTIVVLGQMYILCFHPGPQAAINQNLMENPQN